MVPGTRLLIDMAIKEATLSVNVGADWVDGDDGRRAATSWAVAFGRNLWIERLLFVVDSSGTTLLASDRMYRQSVGFSLAVQFQKTLQLDLSTGIDVLGVDKATRVAIGLVTGL